MDDSDKPKDEARKEEPQKAEDNPWYLLATLYGVGQHDKNRRAWNRYFAARLDPETRAKLIEEKRHPEDELTPFMREERAQIENDFAERAKATTQNVQLPESNWLIVFKDFQFDNTVSIEKFLFTACSFEGAVFSSGPTGFDKATFSQSINFKNATFHGQARFNDASFREIFPLGRQTDFSGAKFLSEALFEDATFAGEVYFNGTIFSGETRFKAASFSKKADFTGATFSEKAYFNGATFSWVEFVGHARFDKDVNFDNAIFTGDADFRNAIFAAQCTFVNGKMKFDTWFEHATFKTKPPRFFGCELHEATVWPSRDENAWPIPASKDDAKEFVRAYERLKLEMDRLKKHEDELDFFALEFQSRRVLLGPWRGWPIWLYGVLSDYGRSYFWPFYWLLATVAAGAWIFRGFDALGPLRSYGLSAANTVNLFGFRKDFFDSDFMKNLPSWLEVVAAVQTILGTILLFLFGLGIRNKFRMK